MKKIFLVCLLFCVQIVYAMTFKEAKEFEYYCSKHYPLENPLFQYCEICKRQTLLTYGYVNYEGEKIYTFFKCDGCDNYAIMEANFDDFINYRTYNYKILFQKK